MQSTNIYESIARAKEFHDIDKSTIIILDAERATWLAYIGKQVKVLFFCQYDKEVTLSDEAEQKLRDWMLQQ